MEATRNSNGSLARLILLLASCLREGWEDDFREITHREIEQLAPLAEEVERDDE